ncbi:MAG: hypothetical protein C0465_25660 [Ralstonia sp.]|uniref:P-loop NTPase n=1 Tax=Ralstonia sp. TaxID=54061 RepID=UPI002580FA57|nr:hypothetical protein [Ralstonia sp.]MBA4233963.1 hypothetical protein [Ralstonia sp.]
MDNIANSGRQDLFISYAGDDKVGRRAAFERNLLQLLSQPAHDYVAEMNVPRVMASFHAQAASADTESSDDEHADVGAALAAGIDNVASQGNDLLSRLSAARKSAACAPAFTRPTDVLRGAHNAEALAACEELVEIAAQRPSRGIWQSLSGKGGTGKTTILLHLACMAHHRGNMNVAVIDLGASEITTATTQSEVVGIAGADLVFVDNADRSPLHSRQTDWWAQFARQVSKSACVLVAMTPDAIGSANAPWRAHAGDCRDTAIGSFDCHFRQALIERLCEQRQIPADVVAMPDGAVERLAEELWGNGWQVGAAVEAYSAYRHVIARHPTLDEIDKIAANIGASAIRHVPSLGKIADAVARTWDPEKDPLRASQHDQGELWRSGIELYVAKSVTGRPLDLLARQLGLERGAAVEAMHRIERARRQNREFCQSLERIEIEFGRLQ